MAWQLKGLCRELQIFIAGKLDVLARRDELAHHGLAAQRAVSRARVTYHYEVSGVRVCKEVFMYAHCVSAHKLSSIHDHLNAGIIAPPHHRSAGTLPWNAASIDEVQEVLQFIITMHPLMVCHSLQLLGDITSLHLHIYPVLQLKSLFMHCM